MPHPLSKETILSFLDRLICVHDWYLKMKNTGRKRNEILEIVAKRFPDMKDRNPSDLLKNLGREYRDTKKSVQQSGPEMTPTLR